MKKLFNVILITMISILLSFSAFACKMGKDSTSESVSVSESISSTSEPDEEITQIFDVTINVVEDGLSGDGSLSSGIKASKDSVVELSIAYSNSIYSGSGVVIATGEADIVLNPEPDKSDGDSGSSSDLSNGQSAESDSSGEVGSGTSISGGALDSTEIVEETEKVKVSFIATCHHIVQGGTKFMVTTTSGKEYTAYLIGSDPITQVSILAVVGELTPCNIVANLDDLSAGEAVFSIGNALGEFGGTVSTGIVSYANREIRYKNIDYNFIQTDFAGQEDTSGGGLFCTSSGALIGIINTMDLGFETDRIGFAMPADTLVEVAEQIMKTYNGNLNGTVKSYGYVEGRVLLGAEFEDSPKLWGSENNYVYISEIDSYGILYMAGLRADDKVTNIRYRQKGTLEYVSVDVVSAKQLQEFLSELKDLKIGDDFIVTRARGDVLRTISVEVKQYVYGG